MDTQTKIQTGFIPCEKNVDTPTILVEPFAPGGTPQVWVQWFGKSDRADLKDMQFRFPVPIDLTDTAWHDRPKAFTVILFGAIVKFPDKEYANKFAKKYLNGDPDARVLYVASSFIGVDDGSGETVPMAFLVPMHIELIDENVGIIRPDEYYSPKALETVQKEFKKK